jgi:hypothetical protein
MLYFCPHYVEMASALDHRFQNLTDNKALVAQTVRLISSA